MTVELKMKCDIMLSDRSVALVHLTTLVLLSLLPHVPRLNLEDVYSAAMTSITSQMYTVASW